MKRIILIYGIIGGLITGGWLIVSLLLLDGMNFENGMWYGYASMLIAFSLIFVGIKTCRDQFNGGFITFGKAFKTGFFISLIASTVYVLVWQIEYHFFIPDFMEKYMATALEKMRAAGKSEAEISAQAAEMKKFGEWYKNPFFNALMTYMEILPVGLAVTLISSLILKKKPE